MISRRPVVLTLVLALLVLPDFALAQAGAKTARVGMLTFGTPATTTPFFDAFARGMADLGYVEGKNIVFERRYAQGQHQQLQVQAKELAALKLDALFVTSTYAAAAAKKATTTLPIVFANLNDPVGDRFVASLAHPARNMTGLTNLNIELGAKRVEILGEAFPKISRIAVLYFMAYPGVGSQLSEVKRAANTFGKELLPVEANGPDRFEAAFAEITNNRAEALVVINNAMFSFHRKAIIGLAAKSRLPTIYNSREHVEAGGLMSYGPNTFDLYRRAATYVDKILKGAKPADLPVEQPTKFELVINLKTAKALGLTIPKELLLRADEVIQ